MKAVGYQQSLASSVPGTASAVPGALEDIELPSPKASGRDVLVRVAAIAVNPVDTKVHRNSQPPPGEFKVLGWDAAGVVEAVGEQVTAFQPGDRIWYAGAIDRPGCNSELHLVDQRIAALMPKSLSFEEAAAMPLTAITAWELLFDRLRCDSQSSGALLILGGAGGVGSMLIQLAKKLTGLIVIATASRPQSQAWVRELGADFIIDHRQSLQQQLQDIGFPQVRFVLSLTHTDEHLPALVDIIAPQGAIGVIDDPASLDILPFKRKSVSFHWELMFTRALFQTADMTEQQRILGRVAGLVDAAELRSTLNEHYGQISAANLQRAHRQLEAGTSIGKIVLSGFTH